jgi:hypothetical protein
MIVLRWLMLVIWPLVAVLGFMSTVWIWNSEARSEWMEKFFQPVYGLWRLRARSLGAASLAMLSTLLVVPLEAQSLLHGGDPWQGGFSETADRAADVGFAGFFLFGLLWVTTNMWGRPRWIVPPYLRPVRAPNRGEGALGPDNSSH